MATTAVAFFCQTPKFAKNFFFFFCFLKLRQEGAKKSNFMLTTITRKPLLLSRLRLDTRLKRQSRKQRFSLVVQKGKLEAKGSFLNLTLFLFFSVYFLKHKFGKGKPCTVTPHTMQYWSSLLQKSLFTRAQCLKITQKSLIQHCERSELILHFEWTKVN